MSGLQETKPSLRRRSVLVPVKSFADAKERLADVLTPEERAELARFLAQEVIGSLPPVPTAVVCDDEEVEAWAQSRDLQVVWAPGKGLNRAVIAGVEALKSQGCDRVMVVHADLAFPSGLRSLDTSADVLVVPDRRHDGTNVLEVPSGSGFTFSYGPGSLHRHLAEAERLGLSVEIIDDPLLGVDVDVPEDLDLTDARTRLWGPEGPHTSALQ